MFDAEEVLRQPEYEPSAEKRVEMNVSNYRKRYPNATPEELECVEQTARNIEACRPAYPPPTAKPTPALPSSAWSPDEAANDRNRADLERIRAASEKYYLNRAKKAGQQ